MRFANVAFLINWTKANLFRRHRQVTRGILTLSKPAKQENGPNQTNSRRKLEAGDLAQSRRTARSPAATRSLTPLTYNSNSLQSPAHLPTLVLLIYPQSRSSTHPSSRATTFLCFDLEPTYGQRPPRAVESQITPLQLDSPQSLSQAAEALTGAPVRFARSLPAPSVAHSSNSASEHPSARPRALASRPARRMGRDIWESAAPARPCS